MCIAEYSTTLALGGGRWVTCVHNFLEFSRTQVTLRLRLASTHLYRKYILYNTISWAVQMLNQPLLMSSCWVYLKPPTIRIHQFQPSPKHTRIHISYHAFHIYIIKIRWHDTAMPKSNASRKPFTGIHSYSDTRFTIYIIITAFNNFSPTQYISNNILHITCRNADQSYHKPFNRFINVQNTPFSFTIYFLSGDGLPWVTETGLDKVTGQDLVFSCPLYFFPQSFSSSFLPLFYCLISILQFPCASVWENTRAWVRHFL